MMKRIRRASKRAEKKIDMEAKKGEKAAKKAGKKAKRGAKKQGKKSRFRLKRQGRKSKRKVRKKGKSMISRVKSAGKSMANNPMKMKMLALAFVAFAIVMFFMFFRPKGCEEDCRLNSQINRDSVALEKIQTEMVAEEVRLHDISEADHRVVSDTLFQHEVAGGDQRATEVDRSDTKPRLQAVVESAERQERAQIAGLLPAAHGALAFVESDSAAVGDLVCFF